MLAVEKLLTYHRRTWHSLSKCSGWRRILCLANQSSQIVFQEWATGNQTGNLRRFVVAAQSSVLQLCYKPACTFDQCSACGDVPLMFGCESKCGVGQPSGNQRELVSDGAHRHYLEFCVFELGPFAPFSFTAACQDDRTFK